MLGVRPRKYQRKEVPDGFEVRRPWRHLPMPGLREGRPAQIGIADQVPRVRQDRRQEARPGLQLRAVAP